MNYNGIIEIEAALLGSLITAPAKGDFAFVKLKSDYFIHQQHQLIFAHMQKLHSEKKHIDGIILGAVFDKEIILNLAANCITTSNNDAYTDTILEYYYKRQSIEAGQRIAASIEAGKPLQDTLATAASSLQEIATRANPEPPETLKTQLMQAVEIILQGKAEATPTGINSLDEMLGGGLLPTGLYSIGARPAMGKTALCLTIAHNVAKSGRNILFFTIEMTPARLLKRLVWSKCPNFASHGGKEQALAYVANQLAELPMQFVDGSQSVEDIIFMTKEAAKKSGTPPIVFIDYLGIMKRPQDNRTTTDQLEHITTKLKSLANELKTSVVLLVQLNRDNTKRDDKRPTLSDIKSSGAVEQDSNVVIFLHREGYYRGEDSNAPSEAELIIAKNREGMVGTALATFYPQKTWFEG